MNAIFGWGIIFLDYFLIDQMDYQILLLMVVKVEGIKCIYMRMSMFTISTL